jgi:hypothetical protein
MGEGTRRHKSLLKGSDFMNPVQPAGLATDALLELQLRVARRADELAQAQQAGTPLNLHCWLVAEAEVLDRRIEYRPIGYSRATGSIRKGRGE